MVELTQTQKIVGIILGVLAIVGGGLYTVVETGKELTCGTGQGWTIEKTVQYDTGTYYETSCQFKTKAWTYANCSEFRATKTKERYGCTEIKLIPKQRTEIVDKQKEIEVKTIYDIRDSMKKLDCTQGCKCYKDKCCDSKRKCAKVNVHNKTINYQEIKVIKDE